MYFDGKLREIGKIDSSLIDIARIVSSTLNWKGNRIYLRDEPNLKAGRLLTLYNTFHRYRMWPEAVWAAFDPILNQILSLYPNHVVVRAEVACILEETEIHPHVDPCWFHYLCPRIHVPIWTNQGCHLIIEDEPFHLEVGRIYEFNNRKLHYAKNTGGTPRVHVIVDVWNLDESKRECHPADPGCDDISLPCRAKPHDLPQLLERYGLI